jgi:fatty acid desaturase
MFTQMFKTTKSRYGALLATAAAATTGAIALAQGAGLATVIWRVLVSFSLVLAFQWSVTAAWDILDVETASTCGEPVRPTSE